MRQHVSVLKFARDMQYEGYRFFLFFFFLSLGNTEEIVFGLNYREPEREWVRGG